MRFFFIGVTLLVTIFSSQAHAITITSLGTWSNLTGTASNESGAGTDTISWGTPPAGGSQSSYDFLGNGGVLVDSNAIDGTQFKIGDFTHSNFPVSDFNFTGADLTVDLDIVSGSILTQGFTFTFSHNETSNSGPCPVGSPPCADIVTIPIATASETVVIGGVTFALTIDGFMTSPGGTVITEFVTEENQSNSAMLFGSLNKTQAPVPEPSTLILMGSGLLGLVAFRKRNQKKE